MSTSEPGRPAADDAPDNQGEGNRDAARRFDAAEQAFVKSGKVDSAAQAARPANPQEAAEMEKAEQAGKSHSKGEDPAITDPGTRSNPQK